MSVCAFPRAVWGKLDGHATIWRLITFEEGLDSCTGGLEEVERLIGVIVELVYRLSVQSCTLWFLWKQISSSSKLGVV